MAFVSTDTRSREDKTYILNSKVYESSDLTVRQCVTSHLDTFTKCSLSKAASGYILEDAKRMLPVPNLLPGSYSQLKSLISHELIHLEKVHVCINDCMLFRGQYNRLETCNICGEERYKPSDTLGRRYPRRSFSYASLSQSLELYFGCSNIAQIMQEAGGGTFVGPLRNLITDITQTDKWSEWTQNEVESESRVVIGINTDGVNPFHSQGIQYSMWPIILVIMNLPSHLRNKENAFILTTVVPSKSPRMCGGGALEPNLDVYVHLLVDELLRLSSIRIYSAYQKAPITVKCKLLLHMMDYQGYAKFFHMLGANSYYPCNVCTVRSERRNTSTGTTKMVVLSHSQENSSCSTRSYNEEVKCLCAILCSVWLSSWVTAMLDCVALHCMTHLEIYPRTASETEREILNATISYQ